MSQTETVAIPLGARKNVAFTRLAQGAGFITSVALGLTLMKVPKEKILIAGALTAGVELINAGYDACADQHVSEEMTKEHFGSHQEKLEAAGKGLAAGFAVIAICVAFIKLTTKGKEDE